MDLISFTLTQLSYVVSLAKHRNFGKAANDCHVTQPSLSMQIQKIEDELGVLLFDRSRQPIEPTDVGAFVIEQARSILSECKILKELTKKSSRTISGTLRLGIIPTVAPSLIPRFLNDFLQDYPDVFLEIDENPTHTIVEKIEHDELDAGILSTPLPHSKFITYPLYYEPFVLCLPKAHPFSQKKDLSLGDLLPDDMLLLDRSNCFRDQVEESCTSFRHQIVDGKKPLMRVRFEASQLETLRRMVAKGHGMTLLPRLMLSDEEISNVSGELIYRTFSSEAPRREVSIIAGKSWLKRPVIEALASSIKKNIPEHMRKKTEGMHLASFSLRGL